MMSIDIIFSHADSSWSQAPTYEICWWIYTPFWPTKEWVPQCINTTAELTQDSKNLQLYNSGKNPYLSLVSFTESVGVFFWTRRSAVFSLRIYNAGKNPYPFTMQNVQNRQCLTCKFTSNVDYLTLSFSLVLLPAIRLKDSNQHPTAYLASK